MLILKNSVIASVILISYDSNNKHEVTIEYYIIRHDIACFCLKMKPNQIKKCHQTKGHATTSTNHKYTPHSVVLS